MNQSEKFIGSLVAAMLVLGVTVAVTAAQQANATTSSSSNPPDHYVVQKTAASDKDPLPGHSGHQLVMAIPPRTDGKIWTGTISWTASKPVELVILHKYDNASVTANQTFAKPLTAPFGGGEVAISLFKVPSNSPVNSGSTEFVGNAVAFHTLNGAKFIVTYTADARAESVSGSSSSGSGSSG
jgi:hypothetical protein